MLTILFERICPGQPRRAELAWIEERRRIAQEVHDRVGEALTGALLRIHLCEITSPHELQQSVIAREALREAIQRLRVVMLDLREEPSQASRRPESLTSVGPFEKCPTERDLNGSRTGPPLARQNSSW